MKKIHISILLANIKDCSLLLSVKTNEVRQYMKKPTNQRLVGFYDVLPRKGRIKIPDA